jgi:esterase/lipase superfamily enzyme
MIREVYFATNRQPLLDPADPAQEKIIGFGSELGPTSGIDVRYGSAKVDVNLSKRTNVLVPGSLNVASQQLVFAAGQSAVLGSDTVFDAIRASMKTDNKPTIAFIHGFSNSFVDSIERGGWLGEFYGIDANVFVFSWPSIISLLPTPTPFGDYAHDRKTAAASGLAIARTIRRLSDFVDKLDVQDRCQQSIHLICHSMGNYVFRNALQALIEMPDPAAPELSALNAMASLQSASPSSPPLRRYFDKVILAAADEDADAFDDPKKLKFLPRMCQSVAVYYSYKDWVLGTLSNGTKFNGPRLGSEGPDNMSSISDKVSGVDVSAVISSSREPENHQYYRVFAAVRDDIKAVLSNVAADKIANRFAVSQGRWAIKPDGVLVATAASTPQNRNPKRKRSV